jgi:hypothetical protein
MVEINHPVLYVTVAILFWGCRQMRNKKFNQFSSGAIVSGCAAKICSVGFSRTRHQGCAYGLKCKVDLAAEAPIVRTIVVLMSYPVPVFAVDLQRAKLPTPR